MAKRKLWVLKERWILSSFSQCESFISDAFWCRGSEVPRIKPQISKNTLSHQHIASFSKGKNLALCSSQTIYHTRKMQVYVTPHLQTYLRLFVSYTNYSFPDIYLKYRKLSTPWKYIFLIIRGFFCPLIERASCQGSWKQNWFKIKEIYKSHMTCNS